MDNLEKHFAVSGFVVNYENTKLLMVYHKKLNKWVIPGGHLEENEYPHDGALREIFEETGVKAEILNPSVLGFVGNDKEQQIPTPYMVLSEFIPEKGDKKAHTHIDLIYFCLAEENQPLKAQEDEVNGVKWMTWEEIINSDIFDSIKALAYKQRYERGGDEKCENSDS